MITYHRAALIAMVGLWGIALLYWGKGFEYLVAGPGGKGAIDLRLRWVDQQYVLHRQNPFDVYFAQQSPSATRVAPNGRDASVLKEIGPPRAVGYPAWSYFSGYLFFCLPWRATRLYYAGIQLICLLWLVRWAFLEGKKTDAVCAGCCAAGVAATASFCTTLANGQYGILVLALLAASLHLEEAGWESVAGVLVGIACLKPNIAGPFIICFVARNHLRALGAAIAYLSVANLWIWMAIHTNPLESLGQMLRGGERFVQTGYGPVSFAVAAGMKPQIATPLIALVGVALSLAICAKYRDRSGLVLFAVAGVVARLWAYHQNYDNLTIVFLLAALAQLAWTKRTVSTVMILAAVGATLWAPAKLTDYCWFEVVQFLVWIGGTVSMLMNSEPAIPDAPSPLWHP